MNHDNGADVLFLWMDEGFGLRLLFSSFVVADCPVYIRCTTMQIMWLLFSLIQWH